MDLYFAFIVLTAFWSGVFLTLGAMEEQALKARTHQVR
jgi:hypothetical protein